MPKVESLKKKSIPLEQQIRFWRAHPDIAAKDLLGVDLDKHQRIVIKNRWRHEQCYDVLSRGTGKTFTAAVFAALRAILIPGHRVGLLAPSFRQSKLIFNEVTNLWDRSPVFQEATIRRPTVTPDMCQVRFKAAPGKIGSVIEALPMGTDGSKIRGARYFDVICDEYAQMDKGVVDTVVRGFAATSADPMERVRLIAEQKRLVKEGLLSEDQIYHPPANKFIFSSTAFFQYNHFWESISSLIHRFQQQHGIAVRTGKDEEGRSADAYTFLGSSLNNQLPYRFMSNGEECYHAFTCEDPSEGFMNMKSIENARKDMSEYHYLMEYFCFFPPDSEGFFRRSMLEKARPSARDSDFFGPILEPRPGMIYTMGLDPAREHDNFACVIFEVDVDNGCVNLVRVITWNRKDFPFIMREIYRIIDHYNIEYFRMDAGGGGTTFRDMLAEYPPAGRAPILEQNYEGHRMKVGERKLGPLVQFSKYEWVHDVNHNMLASLQNGTMKIAGKPTTWSDALDDANKEIEEALVEISSIVTTSSGHRMHWSPPVKGQRDDRYQATLIGFDAAMEVLNRHRKPKRLPMGFWG